MEPGQVLHGDAELVAAALTDAHPGARAFAAHRAAVLGLDPELLAPLLRDDNWIVRAAAARAVGRAGRASSPVQRALEQLLQDDEPTVQRLAVQALGHVGDSGVLDALAAKLRDDDESLWAETIEALGTIGDARAVPVLRGFLANGELLSVTVQALGAIGDARAMEPLVARYTEGVNGFEEWYIVAALRDIGDRQAVFQGMAQHSDDPTRRMLGRVADEWWPDEHAVRAIIAQMADEAQTVRSGAAYRLRNWKLPPDLIEPVREALQKGLRDSDEDVRHWCEETLSEWDEPVED